MHMFNFGFYTTDRECDILPSLCIQDHDNEYCISFGWFTIGMFIEIKKRGHETER